MLATLLVFLFMAVLQVAVYFYARNVVSASAADAARFAAAQDVSLAAGTRRANALVSEGLDDEDAAAIRCAATADRDAPSGLSTVTVRCRGRLRLLFMPIAMPLVIDVRSSSMKEGVP